MHRRSNEEHIFSFKARALGRCATDEANRAFILFIESIPTRTSLY